VKAVVVILRPGAAVGELMRLAKSIGVRVEPMHPDTQHESLSPYFTVEEIPDDRAVAIVDTLRASGLVESAYVRPAPSAAKKP